MSTLTGLISSGGGGGASFSNIHTDTTSGSFTLPNEVIRIAIACVAGGGGGASGLIGWGGSGGNGGNGFFDTFLVPAGTTVHYVLGAGGAGGASLNHGSQGGASYVWLVDSSGNKRAAGGVTGGAGGTKPSGNQPQPTPLPTVPENNSNGLNAIVLIGGRGGLGGDNVPTGSSGTPVDGRLGGSEILTLGYSFNTAGGGDLFATATARGGAGGSSMFSIGASDSSAAGSRGSGGAGFPTSGNGSAGGSGYIEIYY